MISLIVSTMGRVAEIGELFDSLLADASAPFEVILVDQNADGRLDALAAELAERALDAVVLLVAGDGRMPLHRHPPRQLAQPLVGQRGERFACRPGQRITLPAANAEIPHQSQIVLVFDAFGDRRQPQAPGQLDNRMDDFGAATVRLHGPHERAVDLDLVEVQLT